MLKKGKDKLDQAVPLHLQPGAVPPFLLLVVVLPLVVVPLVLPLVAVPLHLQVVLLMATTLVTTADTTMTAITINEKALHFSKYNSC